jgi:hypothetical protein
LPKKQASGYNPTFDGKRDSNTSGTGPLQPRELRHETATFPQGLHTKCSPKQLAGKSNQPRALVPGWPVFQSSFFDSEFLPPVLDCGQARGAFLLTGS